MKESKQVNYFDYYPKNIPQCEESWGNEELKIISELNNIVNGGVEGNYCFIHQTQINKDSIPIKERSWKREYLREAVKGCKYGLEIGFNAGHSSAIILSANSDIVLTSIDICEHPYTVPCAKFLRDHYGNRFNFYGASSQKILKGKKPQMPLDFIHVDGGHGLGNFYFDVDWSLKYLPKGGRLLIDDAYLPDYVKYLSYKVEQEEIKQIQPGRPSSGENILFERL
jgi:predicted O-methyltransferase YrrM